MTTNHHTPIPVGAPANATTFNTPLGQLDSAIDTLQTGVDDAVADVTALDTTVSNLISGGTGFTQLNLSTTTVLTLSGGTITVTRSRHVVDTEASSSYDDLDTITGGVAGDVLVLQSLTSTRVVVVKNSTGNIFLNGGDVHLDNPRKALTLLHDGTQWVPLGDPPERVDRRVGKVLFLEGTSVPLGLPAITSVGTATLSMQADGAYTQYATGASDLALAGVTSTGVSVVQLRHNPTMTVWLRTGNSIANIRWCIGFNFNSVYPTDDNLASLSTQAVIFRYSTPAGDTGFRPVTSSGSAQTVGTAIGTIAVNTAYKLSLWVVNGVAYFAVNDGVPVSIATTMPASTTNLQWNTRLRTLEAVNKDVLFKQITLEMN